MGRGHVLGQTLKPERYRGGKVDWYNHSVIVDDWPDSMASEN